MVRISLSSMMCRGLSAGAAAQAGLALVLLIGLGGMTPLEALAKKEEARKSQETSPPRGEASKPAAQEPEPESDQIMTPFGPVRRPGQTGRPKSGERRPASRQAPAVQESPSASDPQDSPLPPTPVEAQETPPVPTDAGAPQPEPTPAPVAPEGQAPSKPTPAPVAPEGQAPSKPSGANTRVRFSCVDCDLLEFVRNVANELKLNYILDPDVQGVVSIHTYGEIRRSDLMAVLETVLQINGAAIAKVGAMYRIFPSQNAKQLPLDIRRNPVSSDSSAGENRVLQIVPINFVSAADMTELLKPYLSEGGDITYHRTANFLIIIDAPGNLGKLLELVQVFDADVFGDKHVRLYPLENSWAANLVPELENIFAGYALAEESPVRFIPIARLNTVLAISSITASFHEVAWWVAKLDQEGQHREIRNYFLKIQNGDAKDIADLLLQIYGKDGQAAETFLPDGGVQTETPVAGNVGPVSGSGELIQGDIKIVADQRNNALILQCSPQDYAVIEETVRELDRVPRQVLINVKIHEVVLGDDLSMGVSAFLQSRSDPLVSGPSATATTVASGAGGGPVEPGLNLATRVLVGNTRELVAFLNATETRRRSRVLSAPSIIASDNTVARIQVGTQIPILTSRGVVPGGTGGSSLFSSTIQNRSTGVILSVTPRINAGGWVTLDVEQEVSSPGPPPVGGIQSPSINIRSIDTQVTVKNGQTIAIGGIIAEDNGTTRRQVPILGNIPGLGLLFGTTSKESKRTELIALITPHVIEDIEQAVDVTEELKSTLKGLRKALRKAES